MEKRLLISKLILASADVARRYLPLALDKTKEIYNRIGPHKIHKQWFEFAEARILITLQGNYRAKIYIWGGDAGYVLIPAVEWFNTMRFSANPAFFAIGIEEKKNTQGEKINIENVGIEPIIRDFLISNTKPKYTYKGNSFFSVPMLIKNGFYGLALGTTPPIFTMGVGLFKELEEIENSPVKEEFDFISLYKHKRVVGFWDDDEQYIGVSSTAGETGRQFYNLGNTDPSNWRYVDLENVEDYLNILDEEKKTFAYSSLIDLDHKEKIRKYMFYVFKLNDLKRLKPYVYTETIKKRNDSFKFDFKVFGIDFSAQVENLTMEEDTDNEHIKILGRVTRLNEDDVQITYTLKVNNKPYYNIESLIQFKADLFEKLGVNTEKNGQSEYGDTEPGDVLLNVGSGFELDKFVMYFVFWEGNTYTYYGNYPYYSQRDKRIFYRLELDLKQVGSDVDVTFSSNTIEGMKGRNNIDSLGILYEASSHQPQGFIAGKKQTSFTYNYSDAFRVKGYIIHDIEPKSDQGLGIVETTLVKSEKGELKQSRTRTPFPDNPQTIGDDETSALMGGDDWGTYTYKQVLTYDGHEIHNGESDYYLKPRIDEGYNTETQANSNALVFPDPVFSEIPPAFGDFACIFAPKLINDDDGICFVELKDGFKDKRENYTEKLTALKDSEAKIAEKESVVLTAKTNLDLAETELQKASEALINTENLIDLKRTELQNAEQNYSEAEQEHEEAVVALDEAKENLNKAKEDLAETLETSEDSSLISQAKSKITEAKAKITEAKNVLYQAEKKLKNAEKTLESAKTAFTNAETNKTQKELEKVLAEAAEADAKSKHNDVKADFEQTKNEEQIEVKENELKTAKEELDDVQVIKLNNFASFDLIFNVFPNRTYLVLKS